MDVFPEILGQTQSVRSISFATSNKTAQPFPNLRNLTSLEMLSITARVAGQFPSYLADLPLQALSLKGPALSGELPSLLFNKLSGVYIDSNDAALTIPAISTDCTLEYAWLVNMSFNEPFPARLLNCSSLNDLDLSLNSLGPVIPRELFAHPSLSNVDLSNNRFSIIERFVGTAAQTGTFSAPDNNFSGPMTSDLVATMATNFGTWSLARNQLECPREPIEPQLALWNKGELGSSSTTYLAFNYLCLPGTTTPVACPNLVFGPFPADSSGMKTSRVPCTMLPWTCPGTQPAPNAPCISPGRWLVIGSLVVPPTTPIVISGNTTVQGNFTIPTGATITVSFGAVVTVEGCVTVNGDLVVDASGRTISNGTQVDVINFNSSCGTAGGFKNVTVTGATSASCRSIAAANQATSRGLSVVFQVLETPNCNSVPTAGGAVAGSSDLTAIIAGSVAGGVALILIILAIVLWKFRSRIIPAYRMNERMRRIRTTGQE